MSNLAIVPQSGLTAHALLSNTSLFDTYQKLAKIIVTSQLSYGKVGNNEDVIKKERDIFLIMLKGLEIGMLPMQALDSIDVIAGKPAIKPQGMLAQIKSKGLLEWMKIDDDGSGCTVTMKRRGEEHPYVETFSMADADKMMTTEWVSGSKQTISLSQKANWKAQPKTMRKWRAIAACCRTGFPDVIQGMYTPEELGAEVMVSEDGDMVIVDPPPAPATSSGAASPARPLASTPNPITGLTTEEAKAVLGNGNKNGRRIGNPPPAPRTPQAPPQPEEPLTQETLEETDEPPLTEEEETALLPHWSEREDLRGYIIAAIHKQIGDTTLPWETIRTLVPGEATSYNGQEFAKLAVEGWKAKQKPAGTRLGQTATTAAAPAPQSQKQPAQDVIIDAVRYIQSGNTRYLEFAKGNLRIRRYDRSGTFRKEVGDEYYNENGFEQMVPMTAGDEPYSINPIQIFYEAKEGYNVATKCVPITNDKALDQYFGEIPFPEAG